MNIFGLKTGIDKALANVDKIEFHYISRSTLPDIVQVWLNGKHIYQYDWISGVEAYPLSKLGKLHDEYNSRR